MEKNRSMDYYRKMRAKHIKRKKEISEQVYGWDWYRVDGCYSKGKIHCSCPMCTYSKYYDLKRRKDEIEDIRYKEQIQELNLAANF